MVFGCGPFWFAWHLLWLKCYIFGQYNNFSVANESNFRASHLRALCQTAKMMSDSLRSAWAEQKTDKSLAFSSALNGMVCASHTMSISEFFNDFHAISKPFFAHPSMHDAVIIIAATATTVVRIYIITTMAWNYFWKFAQCH